ncbi:MAG: hypothetical protein MK212_17180 [Saprospiraceae bacterium]|nr:hypothetical protein [Saprospiraceae bacterium]
MKLRLVVQEIFGIGYGFIYRMEVIKVLQGATQTKQISLTVPVGLNSNEVLENLSKGEIIELTFEPIESRAIDSLKYVTYTFEDVNGEFWIAAQ